MAEALPKYDHHRRVDVWKFGRQLWRTITTLDEMLSLNLLSAVQHAEIAAWIAQARTPERIMQMPAPLWRSLEMASVLLNVDADLLQPPLLQATL
jgi:hypothetical protein